MIQQILCFFLDKHRRRATIMAFLSLLGISILSCSSKSPLQSREVAAQISQWNADREKTLTEAITYQVQSPLCTAEQFAARLDSQTQYTFSAPLPKSPKKMRSAHIKSDFLCLMENDVYDKASDIWETDWQSFTAPCDRKLSSENEKAKTKAQLIHFFKVAEPYMQNLLCSQELKRIWIGGDGSTSHSNFYIVKGRPFFNLGMKRGVLDYPTDPKVGMNGQLSWYEQKKAKDGKELPPDRYDDGAQVSVHLKPQYSNQITDTDGILMNYLYHEYAHFALHGVLHPPAPQNYNNDQTVWSNGDWVRLSFDWDPSLQFPLEDPVFKTSDPDLQRARETICFFKKLDGKECIHKRILHNDPQYGELLLPHYTNYIPVGSPQTTRSSTGFISNLSGSNPTEQLCEWVSYLSLSRYYEAIQVNLAPNQGQKYTFEIFDQMLNFDRGQQRNFSKAVDYIRKTIEAMDRQLTPFKK